MDIVPVVDLMGGYAVHAQRGQRSRYRPLASPLCASSDPLDVIAAYLALYPFQHLYLADLDAILGQGSQLALIRSIRQRWPTLELWLDAGFQQPDDVVAALELGLTCVIGSERLQALSQYEKLLAKLDGSAHVLSLDFSAHGFLGPPELLAKPDYWPQRIIAMTLGRVGSYDGPHLTLLQELHDRAATRDVYAAGGIRDAADIHALAETGIHGALVASALHDHKLSRAELDRLSAEASRLRAGERR